MSGRTFLYVIANLYLIGGVITVAGVFSLRLVQVPVPMTVAAFFRWSGWLALALLCGAVAGDIL